MNRQWAQIIIGATALTGAFFFGSVMQRRHGDLDKRSTPQPMLENEDLVWQTPAVSPTGILNETPDRTDSAEQAASGGSLPQPMVDSDRERSNLTSPPAAEPTRAGQDLLAAKSDLELEQAGAPPSRKVVQPDFSRWAQSDSGGASAGENSERFGEVAPLLPLGETPPLLEQPKSPVGQVTQLSPRSLEPATSAPAQPTVDPWTAPLSSVLLKPATDSVRLATPPPQPGAGGMLPVDEPPGTPLLPPTAPTGVKSASGNLVPVNQPLTRKVELDTDSFRIHVVRTGDTLQSLAQKYYGKADFYLDIYLANQDQLSSPINLPVGKALKIPDYSR